MQMCPLGDIMFYEITIAEIRSLIWKRFPNAVSRENLEPGGEAENLLFMADVIEALDTSSIRNATKAARWIGWMTRECEILGFWNNDRTRELVRGDVFAKNDLPR